MAESEIIDPNQIEMEVDLSDPEESLKDPNPPESEEHKDKPKSAWNKRNIEMGSMAADAPLIIQPHWGNNDRTKIKAWLIHSDQPSGVGPQEITLDKNEDKNHVFWEHLWQQYSPDQVEENTVHQINIVQKQQKTQKVWEDDQKRNADKTELFDLKTFYMGNDMIKKAGDDSISKNLRRGIRKAGLPEEVRAYASALLLHSFYNMEKQDGGTD